MNGKSMLLLGLAVVCGLGAMYGVRQLLSRDRTQAEMKDVLVAVRDVKVEEVLKPDMVKVVQLPKATAPATGFAAFKDVEGRWVQIKMLADEPIIAGKLAPKDAPPGLVSRIPPGMRAFAIEVNEQTGVSGFVLPDHRVDIVQTKAAGGTPTGNPSVPAEAETILQDVQVLAAGTVFSRPEDKSIQVRTVTLAVSPPQVDVLVAARSRGPLSLSLRGLNDHAIQPPALKPPAIPAPAPRRRLVAEAQPPRRALTIFRGLLAPERIRQSVAADSAGPELAEVTTRRGTPPATRP